MVDWSINSIATFYGDIPLDGEATSVGNGSMVAFKASSIDDVNIAYKAGIKTGGKNEGLPGLIKHLLIGGLLLDDEEQDPGFIIISDPVEIISNEEDKIDLKRWMQVAENGMCNIPIEMIIAIADPDKAISKKYHGIIYHLDDIIESIQGDDSESSVH